MYDVVIIGSGPAGLAAAIYARRAGLKAVTIERNPISGGQVLNTYEVDNYPGLSGISGFDMGVKFREHADKLGCEFMETEVLKIEAEEDREKGELQVAEKHGKREGYRLTTDQGQLEARTVIAAMGASHAKLGIPGEEELCGMGVSYCATCDGAFFKGLDSVVIGGGNTAMEDALYLARFCNNVFVINRSKNFKANRSLLDKANSESKITIYTDMVTQSFEGNGKLEKIIAKNTVTGETGFINAAGAIIAIGVTPDTTLAKNCGIELCPLGFIKTDMFLNTNIPGVFAAGDCRLSPLRQVVTAAADGAVAATSAINFILQK